MEYSPSVKIIKYSFMNLSLEHNNEFKGKLQRLSTVLFHFLESSRTEQTK